MVIRLLWQDLVRQTVDFGAERGRDLLVERLPDMVGDLDLEEVPDTGDLVLDELDMIDLYDKFAGVVQCSVGYVFWFVGCRVLN